MQHLLDEQLNNYALRKMPVKEMLAADSHLARCEECRNRLKDSARQQISISSLITNYQESAKAKIIHLTFEELSAYVHKKLDGVEREIVESHAENCRRCAKELKDLQAFALALKEEPQEETRKSFLQTLIAGFGFSNKPAFGVPQLAGVAGIILVLTGAAALFVVYSSFLNQSRNRNTIASNRTSNSNTVKPTPSPTVSPSPNTNENQEPKPVPTPRKASEGKVEEPQSIIATFVLTPNIARDGEGKKIIVEKNVKTVRLIVGVEGNDYNKYKATLRTAEGATVFSNDSLQAAANKNGKAFTLSIPAKRLASGDYLLIVSGISEQGDDERLGIYQLRVLKK